MPIPIPDDRMERHRRRNVERDGRRGRVRACFALLLCVVLIGCGGEQHGGNVEPESADRGGGNAEPDSTDSSGISAEPDSTDWSIGRLSAPSDPGNGVPPMPVLTEIRTGTHPDYERMTLELAESGGRPGYRLEYVDRPLHECGSGRQIFPVGDAWLELRLEPAAAHTEAGAPTLGDREVDIRGPVLRRIYRTCDFEGIVTLVLAVSTPNPFRVMTLSDPPRLAVDIRR